MGAYVCRRDLLKGLVVIMSNIVGSVSDNPPIRSSTENKLDHVFGLGYGKLRTTVLPDFWSPFEDQL